ncbi:hypothetical protein [Clavibacter michiganensis]|uniref:hypothetical protein n=1 Tax=Clavibacter michiganensis TaxID=28447 RepID=UPI0031FD9586
MSGTPCITDVIRRALAALHEGVTLAVTALDRLGRSTMDTRGFPAQLRAAAPASAYRTPAAATHPPPRDPVSTHSRIRSAIRSLERWPVTKAGCAPFRYVPRNDLSTHRHTGVINEPLLSMRRSSRSIRPRQQRNTATPWRVRPLSSSSTTSMAPHC